jgi:Leucine-rich repeat (LRR) protein
MHISPLKDGLECTTSHDGENSLTFFLNPITPTPDLFFQHGYRLNLDRGHLKKDSGKPIKNVEIDYVLQEVQVSRWKKRILSLSLSHQRLKVQPKVFSFEKLCHLDLSHNEISNFDENFIHLKNLKQLNLTSNKFQELPYNLAYLLELKILNISDNPLQTDSLFLGLIENVETSEGQLKHSHQELKALCQKEIVFINGLLKDSKFSIKIYQEECQQEGFDDLRVLTRLLHNKYSTLEEADQLADLITLENTQNHSREIFQKHFNACLNFSKRKRRKRTINFESFSQSPLLSPQPSPSPEAKKLRPTTDRVVIPSLVRSSSR